MVGGERSAESLQVCVYVVVKSKVSDLPKSIVGVRRSEALGSTAANTSHVDIIVVGPSGREPSIVTHVTIAPHSSAGELLQSLHCLTAANFNNRICQSYYNCNL